MFEEQKEEKSKPASFHDTHTFPIPSHAKNWWRRFVAMLFGQERGFATHPQDNRTLIIIPEESDQKKVNDENKSTENKNPENPENKENSAPYVSSALSSVVSVSSSSPSSLKDWIKSVDMLAQDVISLRAQVNAKSLDQDIDSLGASTYLYQIDRLIMKLREHYLTFRFRLDQFTNQKEVLKRIEFLQAERACAQCFQTTVDLNQALDKLKSSKKIVFSEELIEKIHLLELQTSSLNTSVRTLNQLAHRHQISHLSQFEQDLIHTLLDSQSQTQKYVLSSSHSSSYSFSKQAESTTHLYHAHAQLKQKASEIVNNKDKELVDKIIQNYDSLKKCYVISRKLIISEALEQIGVDLEVLTLEFIKPAPSHEKIMKHLQHLFQRIESLLFSSHRTDSRCSINLFKKTKEVRRNLRKACISHPIAFEFLKQSAVKRTHLLKDKS